MYLKGTSLTTAIMLLALTNTGSAYTTVKDVVHTFYGYADNEPPSAQIAYDCGRGYIAGGVGTYDDPRTMAAGPNSFDKCEIVWDPYLEKYLRFEDQCPECEWGDRGYHIDIWMGSSTSNGGQGLIDCENELTPDRGHDVIRWGFDGHNVNSGPLYDSRCHPENVYPDNP